MGWFLAHLSDASVCCAAAGVVCGGCADASVGCAILDSFVARFSDASESCAVGGVVSGTSHGCFRMLHRIGGQHAGAATVLRLVFA